MEPTQMFGLESKLPVNAEALLRRSSSVAPQPRSYTNEPTPPNAPRQFGNKKMKQKNLDKNIKSWVKSNKNKSNLMPNPMQGWKGENNNIEGIYHAYYGVAQ